MHDELTKVDIRKMQEEIDERKARNASLRENVRAAKELGDLSENDEYRSARREFNRNNSRSITISAEWILLHYDFNRNCSDHQFDKS